MVRYSPRAAKALASLKRQFNDIDIFVEDTANHNMWLLVLKRVLPAEVRLDSVNMLGGRDAVVSACRLDQAESSRKRLYIIDGDLDFLLGRGKPQLRHLYRLRANNIENILICEVALTEAGLEHQPTKTSAEISNLLGAERLLNDLDRVLRPLFVAYATAHLLDPTLQTTGYPVNKLIKNAKSGASLDEIKVASRIFRLYRALGRSVGTVKTRDARSRIAARSAKLPLSRVASGKDYVLPLILLRFRAVCGYPGGAESFKVALARSYRPSVEPSFARTVRSIAARGN